MCKCRHIVPTLLFTLCLVSFARGQAPPAGGPTLTDNYGDQIHSDTLVQPINYREQSQKSNAFYDTILHREYKNPITRFLVRSMVRGRNTSDEGTPTVDFKHNRDYFEHYSGRRISAIYITRANVFAPRDSTEKVGWVQRFIDKLHIPTRERQLAQNLLFRTGDTINPYVMGINEELLRSLPYLSTAYFVILPDRTDSTAVSVYLFARDNWSISGDLRIGGTENEASLFDRNFLGTGDELRFILRGERTLRHISTEVNYTALNLLGSFTDLTVRLGVGSRRNIGQFTVDHPFILPSDWAYGANVERLYQNEGMTLVDTSYYVNRFRLEGWIGKSWPLNRQNGTSIYSAATVVKEQYNSRPPVGERLNPYYHNSTQVLFSVGLVRRNYFQGNMIYGYGRTEDIPYGFRFELVGGRQWAEKLGNRDYWGMRAYWGNLLGDHYLEGGAGVGSYFTPNYTPQQSTIIGHIKYFTPLMRVRTSYIRQFAEIAVTMGFNRLEGEREALRYEQQYGTGIRGLSVNSWLSGYNRLTMSSETVFFTPLFLYHFRFAFFVFGDAGWLGYNNNLFRNRFTGAVGAGIRIKNERLIFSNIQIRLGYAFNRPAEVGYRYFSISNEQNFQEFNFAPGQPQIIPYR